MTSKTYLVTGGTGFIGAALVQRLVRAGQRVRVFDNQSRGAVARLGATAREVELITGDIRDADTVQRAVQGVDSVCHLAFVNGTEFFYTKPDLVLDVGVKGMVNVVDACMRQGVGELILASSSEVYQSPPVVPTDERAPMSIPDPLNPRYSYAAGKIISEIMALNYGRAHFERVLIFRPHNVYGANMGWEHVVPQFILRMKQLAQTQAGDLTFPIQGSGQETRAFVFIDDFIEGVMCVIERGEHLGIYHIGTMEELPITAVARQIAAYFGRTITLVPGTLTQGSTPRRCPDIAKLRALGYAPRYLFADALPQVADWYVAHAHEAPAHDAITL